MRQLIAVVLFALVVFVASSVSWGQEAGVTWESVTWESVTWEGCDGLGVIWE